MLEHYLSRGPFVNLLDACFSYKGARSLRQLWQNIQDLESPVDVFKPFLLLGLLANYNKFEFRNPYRLRLEDFVNEGTIQQIIRGLGTICLQSRDQYVAVQEDIDEGWTLHSTLTYIGLGILAPGKALSQAPNVEDTKEQFATL